MTQNSFFIRWKAHLDSKDPKMHSIALLEMVEMINNGKDASCKEVYLTFVNSDIFHFISLIMSYRWRPSLLLINKIVCHVSEIYEFFRYDFFRVLRGYSNVLNSFPIVSGTCESDERYHQSIFTCLNIVIQRAFKHRCNFSNPDMPLNSFISNLASLHSARFTDLAVLETTNLMVELITAIPCARATDYKFRDENLLATVRKLSVHRQHLDSPVYSLGLVKVLESAINFLPQSFEEVSAEHKFIAKEVVIKFLAIMDYTMLRSNVSFAHFEIFCNVMFFLLTSEKLYLRHKMQLINRFFVQSGHRKLVRLMTNREKSSKPIWYSKVRVVLSQVLFIFMKFVSKSLEVPEVTERNCFNIVFKADMNELSPVNGDQCIETTLMYIFMSFVDMTWKKPAFKRSEVLSNLTFFLATNTVQIGPPFQDLLMKLFTSTYTNLQIKDNYLLPIASVELQKSPKNSKTIDLKFLKWWKEAGDPSPTVFNEAVMDFLKKCDLSQLANMQLGQLDIFDQKLVLKAFLENPSIAMHNKLTTVLCHLRTKDQADFKSILEEFKRLCKNKKHRDQKICNALEVVNRNDGPLNPLLKKTTANVLLTFLKKFDQLEISEDSKLLVVEITTKLVRNDVFQ